MNQFKVLIVNLSIKQRISIGVAAVAVIGGLLLLSNWNRERDFKPLYSNLSQEDAAAVLAKVRESATDFRLGEGGSSVLVPSGKVAETRLQLASAGIPKSGRIGFELFDKTNFGTSDFTEQINYHRALEGEMERTVMSMAEVEQARVHITLPKDSLFTESKQPAKASILLKLKPGAKLSGQNVTAICQLAASAVEGLAPEAVSVVDMRGNLLNRAKKPASGEGSEPDDTLLDYKSKIERDLMAKINTTLEPLLGAEKFRAGVSVDCDFSSGEQSEETFDPTKSVMVSSQKTEDISGGNTASGVPGTASNLPRPTSKPGGGSAGVARRTENVAYQSSRLVKKTKLPQGSVKRVSVSILLDQKLRFEGSGAKAKKIIEPPSPERMKSIRELVAGSIGFSAERGDQLVIESLPFESTLNSEPLQPMAPGTPPSSLPAWLQNALNNTKLMIAGAVGAVVVLLLLFAGVFMLTRKKVQAEVVQVKAEIEAAAATKVDDAQKRIEEAERRMEAQLAENAAQRQIKDQEVLESLRIPAIATKKAEILTKHINEEAKKDPKVMAQIVRAWMGEGTTAR